MSRPDPLAERPRARAVAARALRGEGPRREERRQDEEQRAPDRGAGRREVGIGRDASGRSDSPIAASGPPMLNRRSASEPPATAPASAAGIARRAASVSARTPTCARARAAGPEQGGIEPPMVDDQVGGQRDRVAGEDRELSEEEEHAGSAREQRALRRPRAARAGPSRRTRTRRAAPRARGRGAARRGRAGPAMSAIRSCLERGKGAPGRSSTARPPAARPSRSPRVVNRGPNVRYSLALRRARRAARDRPTR